MLDRFLRLETSAIVAVCAVIAGCVAPIRVPTDAKLVWAGQIDQPLQLKDLLGPISGQIYMVDDTTGRVEGVQTVWPGQPNFRFQVDRGRRYRIYFDERPVAASQPAASAAN